MITCSEPYTLIKYIEDDVYNKVGGLYLPSGEEMDRLFKQQGRRKVNVHNKPKNMYRWGEVVSGELKKGTRVYYSQYDVEEFEYEKQCYNKVLTKHILAYEV